MKLPMRTTLPLLSAVVATTSAFSSVSIPTNMAPTSVPKAPLGQQESKTSSVDSQTSTIEQVDMAAPWKIVLDIGREPLANGMPFDWARSGGRMPLTIPVEFDVSRQPQQSDTATTNNQQTGLVSTLSDTVSMTGPGGAVVRPVVGRSWNVENDNKQLTLELYFPQELARRDVRIEAGTTVKCSGTIFTKSELERLNDEFYKAREAVWEIGGELNEMAGRQGAPKKWNEQTKRWEKRYGNENPLSWMQKRVSYLAAKANQDAKNRQRPDPNLLSAAGRLPGVDEPIYVAKSGVVRAPNGAVMGKWYAEPMDDRAVSYYK